MPRNTHYWCLLLCIIPAITLLAAGWLIISGTVNLTELKEHFSIADLNRDAIALGIALLLAVISLPILTIRLAKIRRVFREGLETKGEVVLFRRFRDRGRIEFEFTHAGNVIRAANPVHLSRAVRGIVIGQPITVIYLPDNLKAAFIKEIYQ